MWRSVIEIVVAQLLPVWELIETKIPLASLRVGGIGSGVIHLARSLGFGRGLSIHPSDQMQCLIACGQSAASEQRFPIFPM